MKPLSNKKRNYCSPQKTQTSIVSWLKNQKKQNSNITPPQTAVERSFQAITAPPIPTSPQKNGALANNPYRLLADQTDPGEPEKTMLMSVKLYEKETQNKGTQAQDEVGEVNSLSIEGRSPERKRLSHKAQQTLRKIRAIKKDLLDNSVRAEIEEVLGKEGLESLPQENAIHEETLIDEAEQHPASGPTIGQHSSQEDTEMENVEISQETTANTPR
jgi:hypothetical protein